MIIPGIFEESFDEIKSKVEEVSQFAHLIQIDVADGKLVDGKTFLDIIKFDEINTPASFELHLMVKEPLNFLEQKVHNVTKMCPQVETITQIYDFITLAKEMGYRVGLSLNPETPILKLRPYMEMIDYVQFMTIHPGGQGREFEDNVLDKITEFRSAYFGFPFQIDGGVNAFTIPKVLKAKITDIVIGSALFQDRDIRNAYVKYLKETQNA